MLCLIQFNHNVTTDVFYVKPIFTNIQTHHWQTNTETSLLTAGSLLVERTDRRWAQICWVHRASLWTMSPWGRVMTVQSSGSSTPWPLSWINRGDWESIPKNWPVWVTDRGYPHTRDWQPGRTLNTSFKCTRSPRKSAASVIYISE